MADDDALSERLDALLAEFAERRRAGEAVSVDDYAARFPDLADDIRELLSTALAVENLKTPSPALAGMQIAPPAPTQFGDLRILGEIGRGGMGVVYEAEQASLGRRVAVKVLLGHLFPDAGQVARFEREARTAASLRHPGIVTVYGVGEHEGLHYFVMELIEGVSLDRVLRQRAQPCGADTALTAVPGAEVVGRVSRFLEGEGSGGRWAPAARLILSAAEALQHAHDHGVLHRDIKPGNLLVGADGRIWIADFGLARALVTDEISQPGQTAGTLRYMAPERFAGEVSVQSDVYALGLTLYELLARGPAVAESAPPVLIQHILSHRIPDLRERAPGIPRDLANIVEKAIAGDPAHRYASAHALADDLRGFLEGRPVSARPVPWTGRLWRWAKRNPLAAAAAAVAVVSLAIATGASGLGYVRTRRALAQARTEQQKAEANATLALDVLDSVFARFSPTSAEDAPALATGDATQASVRMAPLPVLSGDTAGLLRDLLPVYDRLARETGDPRAVRERTAAASRRMGDVLAQLGQYEAAEASYAHALATREEPTTGDKTPHAQLERAQILNRLGQVRAAAADDSGAREAHTQALALLDSLPAPTGEARETQLERAWTHLRLGSGTRPKAPPGGRGGGRPRNNAPDEAADAQVDEATRILNGLLNETAADPDALFLLALCLRERPGASLAAERGVRPRRGPADAITILDQLAREHPEAPEYQYELAATLGTVNLRLAEASPESRRAAEEQFQRALKILERLVRQQPYVARYVAAQASVHYKVGALHRRADEWDLAEPHFKAAVDDMDRLAAQSPAQPSCFLWLVTYGNALADVQARRGQEREDRDLLERNLGVLAKLHGSAPGLMGLEDVTTQTQAQLDGLRRP